MRRVVVVAAAVLALLAGPPLLAGTPAAAAPITDVEVAFDRSRIATVLGERFTIRSEITNTGTTPTDRLIAHLNVASLTSDVYVDPEDWSPNRTIELSPLPAGKGRTLNWDIQVVNAGSFAVYVVVLPDIAEPAGRPLTVSPALHLTAAGRQTLSAGGALPVAVAIPVLLGLFALAARYRTRRKG